MASGLRGSVTREAWVQACRCVQDRVLSQLPHSKGAINRTPARTGSTITTGSRRTRGRKRMYPFSEPAKDFSASSSSQSTADSAEKAPASNPPPSASASPFPAIALERIYDIDPSSGKKGTTEDGKSLRQMLRETHVDAKLMRYLDQHGLGREKRSSMRLRRKEDYGRGRSVAEDRDKAEKAKIAPIEFDATKLGWKKLSEVSTIEELQEKAPPIASTPEVAFVGRSNVGKSTLLNALLGKNTAKVSAKPGETRALHLYALGKVKQPRLVLVDMPGYGFAFAKEEVKASWSELALQFLRARGKTLKRVCLLLDGRHGFKKSDRDFLELLFDPQIRRRLDMHNTPPPKLQLVLTKCDLVQRTELARRVTLVRRQMDEYLPRYTGLPVMLVAARSGAGVGLLQRDLSSMTQRPGARAASKGEGPSSSSSSSSSGGGGGGGREEEKGEGDEAAASAISGTGERRITQSSSGNGRRRKSGSREAERAPTAPVLKQTLWLQKKQARNERRKKKAQVEAGEGRAPQER